MGGVFFNEERVGVWHAASWVFRAMMSALEVTFPEGDPIHELAQLGQVVGGFSMSELSDGDQLKVREFLDNGIAEGIRLTVHSEINERTLDAILYEAEVLRISLREFPRPFDWRTAE